jgi:hypothetical protein
VKSQRGPYIAFGSTEDSVLTPGETPEGGASRRQTRDRNHALQVYVTASEREALKANARQAGLRMSHYLRVAGMNGNIRSVLDLEAVAALAKVNADQGRLGGLLKMYLQERDPDRRTAERLLVEIEAMQGQIKAALRTVIPA